METLGIVFTSTIKENYKHNFEGRINNLRTTLNMWRQRYITVKVKITILNNLALAPLIYVSSVIDPPKTSKHTLIQTIENGGLKLCDFETKVKSLKLS